MCSTAITRVHRRFEQEKLKQDMLALQRMLETKERKMADLTKNSGQVGADVSCVSCVYVCLYMRVYMYMYMLETRSAR